MSVTPAGIPSSALAALMLDFQAHLRVDDDVDAGLLLSYLGAAMVHAEDRTGRLFVRRPVTWRRYGLRALSSPLRLPRLPAVSVISITYLDTAGVEQALAPDQYRLIAPYGETLAAIEAMDGAAWPSARDVTVTYEAGHEVIPEPVRQAVFLLAGHWYENRETVVVGKTVGILPFTVDVLLSPYSVLVV